MIRFVHRLFIFQEPLVIRSETPASGLCCVNGFAEINANINTGGFVKGDTMRIEGEIVNRSNTNIKFLELALVQVANDKLNFPNLSKIFLQAGFMFCSFNRKPEN